MVSLFLPHVILLRFFSWSMKAVKKLLKKRRPEKKIGGLLYFDFISRINDYTVGEEIIPESKYGYVSQTWL